jgi:hypothetical protein
MMTSETELRQAYQHLAESSPTVDSLELRLKNTDRKRRRAPAVLAAAAVVAVVLGCLFWIASRDGGPTPRPTPATPLPHSGIDWRWDFTIKTPAGLTAGERDFTGISQEVQFSVRAGGYCFFAAMPGGTFDPTTISTARESVSINGKPGQYAVITSPAALRSGGPAASQKVIVWSYQPNAWALTWCQSVANGRASAQTLAEAASFEPVPVRLPCRITYLPPGFPIGVVIINAAAKPPNSIVSLQTVFDRTITDLTMLDLNCTPDGRFELSVRGPTGDHGTGGLSRATLAELSKISAGVVLAENKSDPSTWFDGNAAIP